MNRPRTEPGVKPTRKEMGAGQMTMSSAPCVICGRYVSTLPRQYHYCLFPVKGPAHKSCAASR